MIKEVAMDKLGIKKFAVQFRFEPTGNWRTDEVFSVFQLAKSHFYDSVEVAKSDPSVAQYWRVAQLGVTGWEEV